MGTLDHNKATIGTNFGERWMKLSSPKNAMIFTSIITFDWVVERITTQLSPPFTFEDKDKEDKEFIFISCDKFFGVGESMVN